MLTCYSVILTLNKDLLYLSFNLGTFTFPTAKQFPSLSYKPTPVMYVFGTTLKASLTLLVPTYEDAVTDHVEFRE
jgi:hypothetical protein